MGYHGFQFHTDKTVKLEEDLIRRDLHHQCNGNGRKWTTFMIPMVVKMILTKKFFVMSQMLLLKIHFRVLRVARFAARYTSLRI